MQISKLCQVCEGEQGRSTCAKCGRLMGARCQRKIVCKGCCTVA